MDTETKVDIHKVIEKLATVPEYHVLLKELDKFCQTMYNIKDIDGRDKAVPFDVEVRARFIAAQRVENLLQTLKVLQNGRNTEPKTWE